MKIVTASSESKEVLRLKAKNEKLEEKLRQLKLALAKSQSRNVELQTRLVKMRTKNRNTPFQKFQNEYKKTHAEKFESMSKSEAAQHMKRVWREAKLRSPKFSGTESGALVNGGSAIASQSESMKNNTGSISKAGENNEMVIIPSSVTHV